MGRMQTLRAVFRKVAPDLGEPDSDGWAPATCPYCKRPGAFRANLKTGEWLCLPDPPDLPQPTPSSQGLPLPPLVAGTECGRERTRAILEELRRWAAAQDIPWPD